VTCMGDGVMRNIHLVLHPGARGDLEELDVDGRILLKRILTRFPRLCCNLVRRLETVWVLSALASSPWRLKFSC
jgi:hypothetical protein